MLVLKKKNGIRQIIAVTLEKKQNSKIKFLLFKQNAGRLFIKTQDNANLKKKCILFDW